MIRETAYNEVFDSQSHFRLIMDSMARPGKLNQLRGIAIAPPPGLNAASAFIGLALLNADVTCYTSASSAAVQAYLTLNTDSQPADAAQADFLFLRGDDQPDALAEAKTGSLAYPDASALVIIDVEALGKAPVTSSSALRLEGPGVKGQQTVFVRGINESLLVTIREKNAEYPLGIDAILADQAGNILCLPRSGSFSFSRH
jgi:alpha-D-ribose 1-methylphosphonate 5-triphosphate synthase subunit PhnH